MEGGKPLPGASSQAPSFPLLSPRSILLINPSPALVHHFHHHIFYHNLTGLNHGAGGDGDLILEGGAVADEGVVPHGDLSPDIDPGQQLAEGFDPAQSADDAALPDDSMGADVRASPHDAPAPMYAPGSTTASAAT